MANLKLLSQSFIHLFFPRLCQGCSNPLLSLEEVICIGCETHFSRTNYHHFKENETTLRLSGRFPFRYATSLAYFTNEGLIQHLIYGLKYSGRKNNGIFFGREIGISIRDLNWCLDGIVPVPLHKKKLAVRGYNQTDLIAEGISQILKIPVYEHVLVRIKNTSSQTDKTREERIQNVTGAFLVAKKEMIRGKHLLLVDDVMTTGATVESCANELLSVAGVSVSVASVGLAMD